jgi:hypothetical protein
MQHSKFILLTILILFIATVGIVAANTPPPALPSAPNQAPIDGGLAMLAAAGGAYAWRKLRSKNKE